MKPKPTEKPDSKPAKVPAAPRKRVVRARKPAAAPEAPPVPVEKAAAPKPAPAPVASSKPAVLREEPPPTPPAAAPQGYASLVAKSGPAVKPQTVHVLVTGAGGSGRQLKVPSILLEDDRPTSASTGGPGQRYALGPTPPIEKLESEGELPEAYGTQRLMLAARDPHWLYAHWDLTREQMNRYNSLSAEGHLVLRIHSAGAEGKPVEEVQVLPDSRHWFVHVETAGVSYVAELGYYRRGGKWTMISLSTPAMTPPDALSPDTAEEFATIPVALPLEKLVEIVQEALHENVPLAEALQELRAGGHPDLPEIPPEPSRWTPEQAKALASVISMERVRGVWIGSMEITELIQRQLARELSSQAAAQPGPGGAGQAGGPASVTSPYGKAEQPAKGFWFNVNAELVIYGATEKDATVTIGGRQIRLRPDGTFSYRFALPDGSYDLPVVAVSADKTDGRAAELGFSRKTEYRGEVGRHPQDPGLKPPDPDNV
ncbi:MAG: DUF4912 domain-containing protein [Verrucomicrobiota bacterium]